MLRTKVRFALPCPVWLVLLGCLAAGPASAQTYNQAYLPHTLTQRYGLDVGWVTRLQVDLSRGRVASLVLNAGLVLAQTDRAVVQAIDAQTGSTLWTVRVGNPDYPTNAPAADEQVVAVANGTTLYCLNRQNGAILWQAELSGPHNAGCAIGGGFIYVPLARGTLERYRIDRRADEYLDRFPRILHGTGNIDVAPLATDEGVYWGTDKGYVFSLLEKEEIDQFRFRTGGPVRGALTRKSPLLFVPSADGFLYAIDEFQGHLMWQFAAGSRVMESALVSGDRVFAVAEASGLFGLDAATGTRRWFAPGVSRVLSATADRVFALDPRGRIAVLDAASGARLGDLPAEIFDRKITNPTDGAIYMASSTGLVQCLRPRGATPAGQPATTPASPSPSQPAAPATPDNPFGDPAPANPFGGDAPQNNPFGNPFDNP